MADKKVATEASSKKRINISQRTLNFTLIGLAILSALLLTSVIVVYGKYQHARNNPVETQKAQNNADTERVLTALKKVLLVGETQAPTVARVEDAAKLKESNKEFYKEVQKGDYLIIFPTRAVIFREAENKIINIAPIINTAKQDAQAATTPAPAATTTTTNKTTR